MHPTETKEWEKTYPYLPNNEVFDSKPDSRSKLSVERCPLGLVKGDICYTSEKTQWADGKMPAGIPVVFTRYMYGRYVWSRFPINQYAMFRFPDGTERSLRDDVITSTNPKSIRGILKRLTKKFLTKNASMVE